MDPVTVEKLQAMRRYRRNHFFLSLVQCSFSLVCLGLFLSSPLWLPKLCSSLRHFFFVSLPDLVAYLFCPKSLFMLGNAIVMFLVGESRSSASASAPVDVYEEYMARSKGLRGTSVGAGKEEADKGSMVTLKEGVGIEEEEELVGEEKEEEEEEEEEEGEEEELPAEELNRRVEDFIARVNKERRLEAMLVCNG